MRKDFMFMTKPISKVTACAMIYEKVVHCCIDMKQMEVGGYDSWGAIPDSQYLIPANQEYRWGVMIVPM